MCGRYTLTASFGRIQSHFKTHLPDFLRTWQPRYNIAPSQLAPVVVLEDGTPSIRLMKWGLVPSWAKDPAIGFKMINARSETAAEKPSFREALRKRRCLVPADGLYEWKREGKTKTPFYIQPEGAALMAFAGLWETWRAPGGAPLETFTILTTAAQGLMVKLHDRMPIILTTPEDQRAWLEGRDAASFATPALQAYPVSTHVNSPQSDDPGCIVPAEATPARPPDPPQRDQLDFFGPHDAPG